MATTCEAVPTTGIVTWYRVAGKASPETISFETIETTIETIIKDGCNSKPALVG
jgi:hypothetical protein